MHKALIGVVGGGQLGRMIALAGYPLGLHFRFLEPSEGSPAGAVAHRIPGAYDDPAALARFVEGIDLATYEFENVPLPAARFIQTHVPIYPPPEALEAAQDRLREKTLFRSLGIPVPQFIEVDSEDDLQRAVGAIGVPSVLKTRRLGYDGKGQRVLRKGSDIPRAWKALGGDPLILEAHIPFQRELSILAVRSAIGETAFYPLVENHHSEGILRLSLAPAPCAPPVLQRMAEQYAGDVLDALHYVGLLAVELFEVDGGLVVNEMAPRVHNSGHWTIEGADTSQFENHLRAILGLPLGSTESRGYSAMVNLIGSTPDPAGVLAIPGAHLHLYGKRPRPGRKLGHITLCASDGETFETRLRYIRSLV